MELIDKIKDKAYAERIRGSLRWVDHMGAALQQDDMTGWAVIQYEHARHNKMCIDQIAKEMQYYDRVQNIPPPHFSFSAAPLLTQPTAPSPSSGKCVTRHSALELLVLSSEALFALLKVPELP